MRRHSGLWEGALPGEDETVKSFKKLRHLIAFDPKAMSDLGQRHDARTGNFTNEVDRRVRFADLVLHPL